MTSGHNSYNPIEGYKDWIECALQNNPNMNIFIPLAPFDFPNGDPNGTPLDWNTLASDNGFSSIVDMYNFYINEISHNDIVDQLHIEFPSTKIFTISTGQATFNLYQMNMDGVLLNQIEMFSPRETSIFTNQKGHSENIIRETSGLIWLNTIYNTNLSTYTYQTRFNTDLQEIAKQTTNSHNLNYKQ